MTDHNKVQRWKRELERQYLPDDVGIEEVANFKHNYGEEYVLGKVNVESVSCAIKWQRDMVKRAAVELKNRCLEDEKREFDGIIHVDMTYSPSDKYYMMTSTIYNYKMRKAIPILTTWLKSQSALGYYEHFNAFFRYFDVGYTAHNKR
jgi:hypothetical protein